MRNIKYYFSIIILMGIQLMGKSFDVQLHIIPTPKLVMQNESNFQFNNDVNIVLISEETENITYSAEQISGALLKYLKVTSEISESESRRGQIYLRLIDSSENSERIPAKFKNESYRLLISNKNILIEAVTPKGIFYGTQSLIQLIERSADKTLPGVEILDWPDLQVRGISDDISRGQVSKLENFKRIIKHIARYKMNTYMPYIEDVLQFDSFPSIGKDRGALTKDEVKELVKYAKKNFVEVIPIFQTLGHFENILSQKKFLKYAEFPGAASLNVSKREVYKFLEKMMVEVFELFPTEYFHMGADESFDVGLGATKNAVRQSSLADIHKNHYKKIYDICKKYNKKVLMYGDILLNHPEILEDIPKDITIVDWHYGADEEYPSTKTFNESGFNYYVSPSVWNFTSTFPNYTEALPNIKYIIKEGEANGASGMINSNWGDFGAETFKELVLFGYAWSAQCAWNLNKSSLGTFSEDYFDDFFGIKDSRFSQIYQSFSNPFNQILWHEFWRHPLLEFRPHSWWESNLPPVARISWMEWTLPSIERNIYYLEPHVKRNKDHFKILKFLVELDKWYMLKLETQYIFQKKLNDEEINFSQCNAMINRNINSLKKLKSDYKNIWLTYYKKDNLWMIEDKFDRLISYFEETQQKIISNEIIDPLISSKWIYYSKRKRHRISKAKFKKTFKIRNSIKRAQLQLLADTYAKLYINGKFIDEIYVRRSLSLYTEYKRILFIDINKYLKKGKNTIEVVTENFNRRGKAGINLIAKIEWEDDEMTITSDDSWRVKSLMSSTGSWKKAVEADYPYKVIAPNFETGRTSWIER